ncbi:MAG TPA: anti-sigma factor [Gaiellaceae bacterium]|nr:anti-sigma factor [Gaiellaceae bacterium]
MEDDLIHDLAAAYALDALTSSEERSFEVHLALCRQCQEDVAAFSETAASLAFAVPPAAPPTELRERIVATARSDRAEVVELRPRWAYPVAAFAAVAACAAIGLGIWAETLHSRLGTATSAMQSVPLNGARGSLIVSGTHQATLVVSLPHAPQGKTYEAWVMRADSTQSAAIFSGTSATTTVQLKRAVPAGAQVGVTVEPAGGSAQPTSKPVVLSRRVT